LTDTPRLCAFRGGQKGPEIWNTNPGNLTLMQKGLVTIAAPRSNQPKGFWFLALDPNG